MTSIAASVVIVSQGRPDWLKRALASLRYQVNVTFEVIVVADNSSINASRGVGPVRFIPCAERNLSLARNLGIAAARGAVVAFLDDDAVAFPTWLARLAAPVTEGAASWSTGPVRREDGWKIEWNPSLVNELGEDIPMMAENACPAPPLKAIGTNMAFDRAALLAAGGFDESFKFFLEDADISRVLYMAGHRGRACDAEVVHGFAPGFHRRRHRVPKSLYQIGASKAYFLKKHAPPAAFSAAWERFAAAQRRRLLRQMLAGRIDPFAVPRLMKTLEAGREDGLERTPRHALHAKHVRRQEAGPDLAALRPAASWEIVVLDPREMGGRSSAVAKAVVLAAEGVPVLFGPLKARRPFLRFRLMTEDSGFWEWSAGRTLPEAPPPWLRRQFQAEA